MEPHPGAGERFLHSQDSSLHLSPAVLMEEARREASEAPTSQKPGEKIGHWLETVDRVHSHDNPEVLERVKRLYHDKFVIKPEDVPESSFLIQQAIARANGHGTIEITDDFREQKTAQIITDQEGSLDRWVNYLSSDDAQYPMWAKYWAFEAVTKMGKYEKNDTSARFARRDNTTTAAFPPVNASALAQTIGAMKHHIAQKGLPRVDRQAPNNLSRQLSDDGFQQLASSENFSKLYAQFLSEAPQYSEEGLQETTGEWKLFHQGSDPEELVTSMLGHPLEWCVTDSGTAENYLNQGDMHIYYSNDKTGEPKVPRAAIRLVAGEIAEVRGIAPNQNLDPYIGEVVEGKMTEFSDGEQYAQKAADMQRVTQIDEAVKSGAALTPADLMFLYQVDHEIKGFGLEQDPRLGELLQGRNTIQDLNGIFAANPTIAGNVYLRGLTSAEGLELAQFIGGGIYLNSLISAVGLNLPDTIDGTLDLRNLTSAAGLNLPRAIAGNLYLDSLTSAEGLNLPNAVDGEVCILGLDPSDFDDLVRSRPDLNFFSEYSSTV